MCDHGCRKAADCAHDRETDEWVVPANLRRPPTASVSVPETRAGADRMSAPALTADGFKEALLAAAREQAAIQRALRRDGGER